MVIAQLREHQRFDIFSHVARSKNYLRRKRFYSNKIGALQLKISNKKEVASLFPWEMYGVKVVAKPTLEHCQYADVC